MKVRFVPITFLLLAAAIVLRHSSIAWAQGEEGHKQQLQALGEPSIVSRDYIQEDLKLSDDQKQRLRQELGDDLKVADAREKLWAFLKEMLRPERFRRFQHLELQHEGPPALLRPEIAKDLKITDEQRGQFMGLIRDMQKTTLHIGWGVRSAPLERNDVIHHVAGTRSSWFSGGWAGMRLLEFAPGRGTSFRYAGVAALNRRLVPALASRYRAGLASAGSGEEGRKSENPFHE